MSNRRENLIVGLDIGTTKICAIVGNLNDDGGIDIVGIGTSVSQGMRKGVVINIEGTVGAIKKALQEAELMAGCEIKSVFAGIAGGHIKGMNSQGVIAIKNREVNNDDIRRVIDAAKAVAIPMDREILHILPQEFTVDDQQGIKDPTGMAGIRLEVDVHIVTGAVSSAQNLVKAIQKAGYQVRDLVLEPLASSFGVLTDDERELGVALVDIGGGTTDIALFHEGAIRHTAVIGLGGNSVTNDIAIGLRCPARDAERIKERYGAAMTRIVDEDEEIVVPRVAGQGEKHVSRRMLASIIQPRMEEILQLVVTDIRKTRWYDKIPSGIVLTGGASALSGTAELAEALFDLPVRIGYPIGVTGLVDSVDDPRFATVVGLVIHARDRGREEVRFAGGDDDTLWHRIRDRMKEWLHDFF